MFGNHQRMSWPLIYTRSLEPGFFPKDYSHQHPSSGRTSCMKMPYICMTIWHQRKRPSGAVHTLCCTLRLALLMQLLYKSTFLCIIILIDPIESMKQMRQQRRMSLRSMLRTVALLVKEHMS